MNIQRPALRYEFNLNTIVQIVGFAGLIWTAGQGWSNHDARLKDLEETTVKHDARLANVETDLRKYDNLAYRITVVETANAAVTQKLDTLQTTLNTQSGDIRVLRQILESQSKPALFDFRRVPDIARASAD